jgi:hypothetical protein
MCIGARNRESACSHQVSVLTAAILTLELIICLARLADAATLPRTSPHTRPSPLPSAIALPEIAPLNTLQSSSVPQTQRRSFLDRDAVPIYVIAQIVTASAQVAAILGLFVGGAWVLILYQVGAS